MHHAHIVVEEIQITSSWSSGKANLEHPLTPVWVLVMLAAGFVIIVVFYTMCITTLTSLNYALCSMSLLFCTIKEKIQMKYFHKKCVRVCSSCHLCVTVAAADSCVDSHTLGTVLSFNPQSVILQHAGIHRPNRPHTQQHASHS